MQPSRGSGRSAAAGGGPVAVAAPISPAAKAAAGSTSPCIEEPSEPTPDVFCGLGSLIVEGRVPSGNGERGFVEGPHVPQPAPAAAVKGAVATKAAVQKRHQCSSDDYLCQKDENFRKHMLLLWQNDVPVSIEVLLCPDCRMGRQKAKSIEFSTIPEPGSILLEQWTVAVQNRSSSDRLISSRGLFQAVRSYLHFSQFSAWLSSSRGQNPKNVLYRITIPGEAFASKFQIPPEQHYFPTAGVGTMSTVQVSVRSLPRTDEIPRVICGHQQISSGLPQRQQSSSSEDDEENKLMGIAGALAWKDDSESDLRKALVRSKILAADCQAGLPGDSPSAAGRELPCSDSMDSMLGDSLLDPPQSLQRIPPKRYQSPSRCGSPSMEAPEHLLFGAKSTARDQQRCARQDLLRRRDLNHFDGLHPRILNPSSSLPKLSLPPKSGRNLGSSGSAFPRGSPVIPRRPSCQPVVKSGQMMCQVRFQHDCSLNLSPSSPVKKTPSEDEDDGEGDEWIHEYSLHEDEESVAKCVKQKRRYLADDEVTRYNWREKDDVDPVRAPEKPAVLDKGALLLDSIIRTSERNRFLEEEVVNKTGLEEVEAAAAALEEQKLSSIDRERSSRVRSSSENGAQLLQPLDLSFDDEEDEDEDEDGEEDDEEVLHSSSTVPSSTEMDLFRKSFDSAASMVFHRRTGLPLTSSPAPLRKGNTNFDFDSSINSPHDIKRALFPEDVMDKKSSLKKVSTASSCLHRRTKQKSNKLLSLSAPATVTSSNLLGNFEESVLNGRLEPVSTVEGFTAQIGASGSFHPGHRTLPVTVFFYTLCDNNNVSSSPYLGHINLGKKGYRVPEKGTIQVTLFNPLGTVVKMFVVVYDLSDMPPNSQTFLRQRTLYMPSNCLSNSEEDQHKWLRYLIHLRFASSRSGKIYLHTDVRMIIFRKSDLDTAADHNPGKGFELRSFTRGPSNPKFSPRK